MPELPEVETVCRGLARRLVGLRLDTIATRRRDLRWPLPKNLRVLEGLRLASIKRRAKYILFRFRGAAQPAAKPSARHTEWVLLSHLGMSGRMALRNLPLGPLGRHDHVVLTFKKPAAKIQVALVYTDPRRFGMMDLVARDRLDQHPRLKGLGPEPMSPEFTGAVLSAALKSRKTPIKSALLDQRVVAGLGNIYVSEALFRAGVKPMAEAARITGQCARRIVAAIKAVLRDAIAAGGSTLRDYAHADGELGRFQAQFRVYGREGEPCPKCHAPILRAVQAGRSSFYCGHCQS
jgi:formamidopyrimidine-DNA glycosylase